MIEVGQDGLGRWTWTLITAAGRILVYREDYCSQACALRAARAYRLAFFVAAGLVDHRQGADL